MWFRVGVLRKSVALCLLAYLGLAVLATLPAWLHGPTHTLQCGGCQDVGQEVWFLRWTVTALAHGHNPLVSSYINVPYGVNLTENTSMPLIGLLAAPLTLSIGPVATINVLFALGFATSAGAGFFAVRRYVDNVVAAFAGGLIYGFSPFMIGQGRDHLFLVAGALPPLMVICLDEILMSRRHRTRAAILLGVLAAAQLLVSVEMLAIFGLLAAFALVLVAAARHKSPASRAARPARASPAPEARKTAACLGIAALVFALLAAYPAYVALAGPYRVSTALHPVAILHRLSTDVAGIVLPNPNERFSFGLASTTRQWVRLAAAAGPSTGDLEENGGYIGIPLLLFLAAGIFRYRKDQVVKLFAALAAIALVFSFGSRLHVYGHFTSVPLPFALLTRVPFLGNEVAIRYADGMWLCVGFLSARLIDRAATDWASWKATARGPSRRAATVGAAAAVAVTLASLTPGWPYDYADTSIPTWFQSAHASQVPSGTTLLAYPFPKKPHASAMLWQAFDGIGYRIVGGQAVLARTRTSATETVFEDCLATGTAPSLTPARLAAMRNDLKVFGVSTVVIPRQYPGWSCATSAMHQVINQPPLLEDGAEVWRINR